MRFILPIAALVALSMSTSCGKQDYTCVCKDQNGVKQEKRYDVETRNQSQAVEKCSTHETELNHSSSSYHCELE